MMHCEINIKEKVFSKKFILNNLILNIKNNEFISIVGPSGTGKTTLLNIIGGLDSDYSGGIQFNHDIQNHNAISYVFQEPRLMPWLTVYENIDIVIPKHISNREALINDLLINTNLSEYKSSFPNQLSGGMQRRVGLARAFSIKPSMLLMDEPFISLDLPTANSLRQFLINILTDYKPTILFVTHDLMEALALSDRVIFLSQKPTHIIHEIKIKHGSSTMYEREQTAKALHENLNDEHPNILDGVLKQTIN